MHPKYNNSVHAICSCIGPNVVQMPVEAFRNIWFFSYFSWQDVQRVMGYAAVWSWCMELYDISLTLNDTLLGT